MFAFCLFVFFVVVVVGLFLFVFVFVWGGGGGGCDNWGQADSQAFRRTPTANNTGFVSRLSPSVACRFHLTVRPWFEQIINLLRVHWDCEYENIFCICYRIVPWVRSHKNPKYLQESRFYNIKKVFSFLCFFARCLMLLIKNIYLYHVFCPFSLSVSCELSAWQVQKQCGSLR